jgi:cob(I)alamin adenosyltransferase
MKIYTGDGDHGKTSLFSGERVSKSHDRIEAYGDVDELNSVMGVLGAVMQEAAPLLLEQNRRIQSDLLHVGAWLATTPGAARQQALKEFTVERVRFLEVAIDGMEEGLPPLRRFILPGGHLCSAIAQMARTVCRRAERRVVRLFQQADNALPASWRHLLAYLNRLSDYLFVLARTINRLNGVADITWGPETGEGS